MGKRIFMKDIIARAIILIVDMFVIAISLGLGYVLYSVLDSTFSHALDENMIKYLTYPWVYVVVIFMFIFEHVYTRRHDFWHESRQIIKALIFSFLIVMSILAMTHTVMDYSLPVIVFAFMFMVLLIPLFKNITKKTLYRIGWWRQEARVIGDKKYVEEEIFGNPYLGYVNVEKDEAEVVFINSNGFETDELQEMINEEIQKRKKVIFIPTLHDFDLTRSRIYQLSNARVSLVVLQNRLKSSHRILMKWISDKCMAIAIFPFLVPLFAYIAYRIKQEEPEGSVFFKQERIGKNGEMFICYKFRTMREDGDVVLAAYLEEHPEELAYYETYHKYLNDPRITKIGALLRHTSLDEIPQIFNVFKGEMSVVGPRPYMLNEKEKIGDAIDTIREVSPGITGLWQVSGRSDVDFHSRVKLDVWYIRNWSLWMDIMILAKTIKVVLVKEGAS